jgi:hypothetical protein
LVSKLVLAWNVPAVISASDVTGSAYVRDGSAGVAIEVSDVPGVATNPKHTARAGADDNEPVKLVQRRGQRHARSPPRTAPVKTTYNRAIHPTVAYLTSWLIVVPHRQRIRERFDLGPDRDTRLAGLALGW